MLAPLPEFGIDIYNSDVEKEDVIILSNNGNGNKGIPIRCDHYIVVFCKNGEGYKRINHHRFHIVKNSVHIIEPGNIHSFSNTSSDFEIIILLFKKSIFSKLAIPEPVLDKLLHIDSECTPNIKLKSHEFARWNNKLIELNEELKQRKSFYNEAVNGLLINLFSSIKRKLEHQTATIPKKSRQQEIFDRYKQLIEQHFRTKKKVKDYADLMAITPKHLSETIKDLSNNSALHYIHERILNETEYLLAYSDASISEIAYSLNYNNPSHFGRFFKSYRGTTPLKYKTNFR